MTMTITPAAITALATLVHALRPEWDQRGIAAAVHKLAHLPLDQVAIAFVRGSADPANETPAALVHLNNRAWDSDWYLPCKAHPNTRARRTNGECAACWSDRQEDLEARAAHHRRQIREEEAIAARIPTEARDQMLAAISASIRSRQTPPTEERKDEEAVDV